MSTSGSITPKERLEQHVPEVDYMASFLVQVHALEFRVLTHS